MSISSSRVTGGHKMKHIYVPGRVFMGAKIFKFLVRLRHLCLNMWQTVAHACQVCTVGRPLPFVCCFVTVVCACGPVGKSVKPWILSQKHFLFLLSTEYISLHHLLLFVSNKYIAGGSWSSISLNQCVKFHISLDDDIHFPGVGLCLIQSDSMATGRTWFKI
jgi:hypothetical protein